MTLRRDEAININIRRKEDSEITVVEVRGVIDTGTTLILDEYLSGLLRENYFKILINMLEVTYVSSAGWGLFVSLLQKTREQDGDIKLFAMKYEVSNVFNMLAFHNLILTYETEQEAVAAFR